MQVEPQQVLELLVPLELAAWQLCSVVERQRVPKLLLNVDTTKVLVLLYVETCLYTCYPS